MNLTIYHNPRCSKSRQTLEILRQNGREPVIVEYLKTPPDAAALKDLLSRLRLTARDVLRTGEALYRELELAGETSEDKLIAAIAAHPILLERPIVVSGKRAVIGRPPEKVLELL
ncbi:MAG: arsenate reductase (glutaredoxin) [Rhodobiaceae bacterium]|nr:arsenate reductase (glutaredoxin) [Rhodobiaceae bacterium]